MPDRSESYLRGIIDMAACPVCAYADEHGWWGPGHSGRSHCRRCHRSWRGTKAAHCTICCEHFFSDKAFVRHLTPRGCAPPGAVVDRDDEPAFVLREDDVWVLARYAPSGTVVDRHPPSRRPA